MIFRLSTFLVGALQLSENVRLLQRVFFYRVVNNNEKSISCTPKTENGPKNPTHYATKVRNGKLSVLHKLHKKPLYNC